MERHHSPKLRNKTNLAFNGKDLRTEISKDNNCKHVIQELSYNNQWRIHSLNYYHERKLAHLFQAEPIVELAPKITLKRMFSEFSVRVGSLQEGNALNMRLNS